MSAHDNFSSHLRSFHVSEAAGRELRVLAVSYPRQWRFWYVCQRTERASVRDIFSFSLPPFNFYKLGGEEEKGVPVDLTLIGGTFGMHASGSEGWACETFSYFKLCPFNFHGLFVCVCVCVCVCIY